MDTHFGANFAECFESLSNLLSESEGAAQQPAEVSRAKAGACGGPGGLGPQGVFPDVKVAEPIGHEDDTNEIWSDSEVCDILDTSINDGRIVPEYEFRYKQAVDTADMYLGLDPMGKNPTSTTCEDLMLLVTLPDVKSVGCINVDLTSTAVTLLTAKHRLSTYLPHKVDEGKSKAEWDARKQQLKITMRRLDVET
eukprot:jgi/Ulvmu1/11471/UM077_0015.1